MEGEYAIFLFLKLRIAQPWLTPACWHNTDLHQIGLFDVPVW
jgi:hypothetical protein